MTTTEKKLGALRVIDRLQVGPVQLSPDKLVMPYVVRQQGRSESSELIYKYQEPVFDPQDRQARNLAEMIGAQVALNYGLFCREMVFCGSFDAHDRRFLEEMARNTAREIYVNKLLRPNPFLLPPANALPPDKLSDYLRAEVIFSESGEQARAGAESSAWEVDPRRCAVLSSGGKDSLLTYGLLDELDVEVHPVFVNESGRHWYTALNAYRHFSQQVPRTARVWTNADRLFSWMLRQLPFVRQDFASQRADGYPLRLWTVAVFLFGALPLLCKRGIGRLLIGDEYDTSLRLSYKGISHYGGLYDQSRFFDNALTRYYRRKRWGLSQFSALRPLSELLIQKILVQRYPELQRLQVSCHAAHLEGERVLPCGRCEKCRRIVGMLVAIGADPQVCGYTPAQIDGTLKALAGGALHQETAVSQQVYQLLLERDQIPLDSPAGRSARPHPEVLRLRFSPEPSPLDTLPNDLRLPLYRLYLEHAEGAYRRQGKLWQEFDPLGSESLSTPYRFEGARGRVRAAAGRTGSDEQYLLATLTWPEAQARLREVDTALLPVGAIEQHGPHLPLDVDAFDADLLCREVAAACRPPRPLVLPLIPYGVSYHHDDFPGTISIAPATLSQLVCDIGMTLARQGITKLVIVNGHGGNGPALHFAAQLINRDAKIFVCVDTGESSDAEIDALVTTSNDVHGGEIETSTTLARRPEQVKMALARRSTPHFSSDYLEFSSKKGVGWYVHTAKISANGVLGDPTKASAEKGARIWEIMVRNLVELVEDIKGMPLDEIYQRRY